MAADLGVSRSTLARMAKAHESMRSYKVQLERDGSPTMSVCEVVTPEGAQAAAVAAFREYPGTLKNLELPGWRLRVGEASFSLENVRELARSRRAA